MTKRKQAEATARIDTKDLRRIFKHAVKLIGQLAADIWEFFEEYEDDIREAVAKQKRQQRSKRKEG